MKKHIVMMTGGGSAEEAANFLGLLGPALEDRFTCHCYEGAAAFGHLGRCDVLVLLGHHSPTQTGPRYEPLGREAKISFGAFVSSGRPLVVTAEAVGSFPDWPRFGELIGYELVEEPPYAQGENSAANTGKNPSLPNASQLSLYAEPSAFCAELNGTHVPAALAPRRVVPRLGMQSDLLASAKPPDDDSIPLIMCAQGGPRPGAGLTLYMGLGPAWADALGPATLVRLWRRALLWLVGEPEAALMAEG